MRHFRSFATAALMLAVATLPSMLYAQTTLTIPEPEVDFGDLTTQLLTIVMGLMGSVVVAYFALKFVNIGARKVGAWFSRA